jgi:homoserine acetyltransferase
VLQTLPEVQDVDLMTVANFDIFEIENLALQCGTHLGCARLAFKTYGQLNGAGDNAVLMPTYYACTAVTQL